MTQIVDGRKVIASYMDLNRGLGRGVCQETAPCRKLCHEYMERMGIDRSKLDMVHSGHDQITYCLPKKKQGSVEG